MRKMVDKTEFLMYNSMCRKYADMVKSVNTPALGAGAYACGFESHYPHHPAAECGILVALELVTTNPKMRG